MDIQGYRHLISVAEWWQLKTPFTQWFTKNWSSVYRPLAAQMEVADGHALASDVGVSIVCEVSCMSVGQIVR